MTTAFITHADCLKHDMGAHHPERPARLTAIEDQLIASGPRWRTSRATKRRSPTDEQLDARAPGRLRARDS
jgi:acetoin utilization deacetylase AcuC-like enzyme